MSGRFSSCVRDEGAGRAVILQVEKASAKLYELCTADVMDPRQVKSSEIAFGGVKLGDPESGVLEILANEKIPWGQGGARGAVMTYETQGSSELSW